MRTVIRCCVEAFWIFTVFAMATLFGVLMAYSQIQGGLQW